MTMPDPDAFRNSFLLLQQQQRAAFTRLIEQTEAALAADWQRGPAIIAQYYTPLIDEYAKALADLRLAEDNPAATLSLDWLTSRNAQLNTIEQSIRYSLDQYGHDAQAAVTAAQSAAIDSGLSDAAQLTQRSLWPAVEGAGVPPAMLFSRPDPNALAAWVGRSSNGHPLGDLFANFGAEAASSARKEMLLGLAMGANPRAMAQGVANALGISRSRATIIARTEVLGSYRTAQMETYRANSDVVSGWLWSASGSNPCAACMGMDGLQFSLEEELIDHPCGRCAALPITRSWDDILGPLGIDASDMTETSIGEDGAYFGGEERFAQMSPEQQRAIIGTNTGYEAFRRGEVSLRDFVGQREGGMLYQKSLRELQIPTRNARTLVEPSSRIAGPHRARERGQLTPLEQMPAWAKQSEASRNVYQILRNGLPYDLMSHEQGLLITNLEQMLREELPVNVRAAVERQLQMMGQAVERTTVGQTIRDVEAAVLRGVGKSGRLSDAEFQQAVLDAHVRNADSSGYSSIRQIRNEVVQETGISRAEFDARLRAWYDAAPQNPDDLVVHFETNMDAHPGIRGRLDVDGRQYDFLQMSRGSEFERIIAGNAPSGNAYAGSLRGITREAFEAEQGIGTVATTAAEVLDQEITGAAINLERMTADQLAAEEARILAVIRPPWDDAIRAQERVGEVLGQRLAGNAEFLKIGPKMHAYLTDLAGFSNLRVNDPEDIAGALLRAWSGGTDNIISKALRLAIQDEFGLADTSGLSDALLKSAADWADVQPGLRAFVREMYNNTQDYLREQGITEMPLFRGNTLRELPPSIDKALIDGQIHEIQIALQAASSFTADEKWAAEFATFSQSGKAEYSVAMAGRIPAELVLSTAQTGLGNIGEAEVLLLGGNYDLAMIGTRLAETKLTPDEIASLLTQSLERTTVGQAAQSVEEVVAREAAQQAVETVLPEDARVALKDAIDQAMNAGSLMTREAYDREIIGPLADRLANNPEWQQLLDKIRSGDMQTIHEARLHGLQTTSDVVKTFIERWTMGSDSPEGVAMRYAAISEFNLANGLSSVTKDAEMLARVQADYSDVLGGLRAMLRVMHDQTQEWFDQRGIESVRLYRGLSSPEAIGSAAQKVVADLRPISSFSVDLELAAEFASMYGDLGRVYALDVPISDILATPLTGLGEAEKWEVLLLGGNYDGVMAGGLKFSEDLETWDARIAELEKSLGNTLDSGF